MSFIEKYMPSMSEDPLAKYRPFPAEPTSVFAAHWHELVGSFIFYVIIQALSDPIFSRIMGTRYTSLPKKVKINFDIHVVSMVQCFVSISVLVPHLFNSHYLNRVEDPVGSLKGTTPFGGMVCALTVGYFVWDVYVCTKYYSIFGLGFLFHGFAAMYAYSCGFIPYCQPWAGPFLVFELSTPFVNINWFASKLPAGTFSEKTIIINGLLLIATFFTVRILWGFAMIYKLATDMFNTWHLVPWFVPLSMLVLNFFLNCLNVFWFLKMVMIAKKKAAGRETTLQAAREADKIE